MSQELRVIAHIKVHPDQIEALKEAWFATLEATRGESGVVSYEVHQNPEDPTDFMAIEIYKSPEAFQSHMASPHIQGLFAKAGPLLAAPPDIRAYVKIA